MLSDSNVQPMLPVKDLKVAAKFYEETLSFERLGETDGQAVVYRSGDGTLCIYRSEFAGTNKGTAALWGVKDIDGLVRELKAKGVNFEHYDDLPALTRKGDVHSAGDFQVVWFKDPDGNILSAQNQVLGR
ncbi:MAG TPA: VOC family protein [Thermoanaerobaculia bacterium]|nr:VOC family protein [Thermoanaerobaculia bacterium]